MSAAKRFYLFVYGFSTTSLGSSGALPIIPLTASLPRLLVIFSYNNSSIFRDQENLNLLHQISFNQHSFKALPRLWPRGEEEGGKQG